MTDREARTMLERCFCKENDAINQAYELHRTAVESYKVYVDSIQYLNEQNRNMQIMGSNSIQQYLKTNAQALRKFEGPKPKFEEAKLCLSA